MAQSSQRDSSSSSSSSEDSSSSSSSTNSSSDSNSSSSYSSGSSSSHSSDSENYLSDDVLPQRVDDSMWDPVENRVKLAQRPDAPNIMSRATIMRTSPAKSYLKRVLEHARIARPGDEAEEERPNRGPDRPMPDKPIVPDPFSNPDESNPVVADPTEHQTICSICLEREVKTMCLPCGQMVMCNPCSQHYKQWIADSSELAKCPTCRQKITQITAVYGQVAPGSKKNKRHKKHRRGGTTEAPKDQAAG
jgi:hypothetical protein